MIKCEVIENFTLEKFNELGNVKKVQVRKDNEFGKGDTFNCDKNMAEYLTGKNVLNKIVVKVIEILPEIKELKSSKNTNFKVEENGSLKVTKKKTSKKK